MRVCSECAGVHLPPSMYMCMAASTNVLPPHLPIPAPTPQITKQKGLASGEWVPLLLTPPDLPSWTIGHLRLVCTEEKKYMYSSTG